MTDSVKIEPKIAWTTIKRVHEANPYYDKGIGHVCYRMDEGYVLEVKWREPYPEEGQKVMIWFEPQKTKFDACSENWEREDIGIPCVVAWDGYMVDLKNAISNRYPWDYLHENFLKSDDYDFDAATRRHYNKYKKEFLRAREKKRDIAKLKSQKKVVESIEVANDLTSYQAAKNDVINYLNGQISEYQTAKNDIANCLKRQISKIRQ